MKTSMVRVGKHIINIEHVADAKWEGDKLYIHFHGGSFADFRGRDAELVWSAIDKFTMNLDTGETKQ
jgi:hypothetical protein